ncbi:MAG: ABC transporter permease subunit [Clostridiaceae bacterium]|jgi:peptide/nickel transport system permease protein|nr:ABC transporter permease subunit [Clostridiaceae bacterium]
MSVKKKVNKKQANNQPPKKKRNFLVRWFRSTVLRKHDIDYDSAEVIETPLQIVVQNFFSKKSAIFGVVVFSLILLLVLVGPYFWQLNLGEQDSTLTNIPPGYAMMKLPKELKGNVRDIAPGRTYGVGIDNDGHVYTWGHSRISERIDIKDIPDEVQEAELKFISAGDDHVVALDTSGKLYVWGNDRRGQGVFTSDMVGAMKSGRNWDIIQLEAANQCSAALDAGGYLYLWGNTSNMDLKVRKQYQGEIAKISFTANEYIALLKDGNVAYTGFKGKGSPYSNIPEELLQGKTVDIASTAKSMAGLTEDGKIYIWGKVDRNEGNIPDFDSKVVQLYGGRFHYSALLEDGTVVSWGENNFNQVSVPAGARSGDVEKLFVGYFQNYAIRSDGSEVTWGLKGFPLGTDDLGRDMLTRIINGGRVTMLVGAIAVIIATIIGIVLGGIAGYFGGTVDIIIMRIAEIIGGLPFIPFAMILSAVIGSRLNPQQRMYLIMVVLGILSWVGTCRLVRAQFFAQRELDYVTAAKAMGIREFGIIFRHIMPNVFSLLLVSMTLDFATSMLTESTLSYLGFGIPLPTPTWGNLLNGANSSIVIQQFWWRWVFPAVIFGLCTICINLIGDAMRDAMDPKSVER